MSLKKHVTSGFTWTFAQQFGHQIIGFLVSLVLARILLPEEFGLIGMIAVLIGLGRALVHSGMTQSLIRSENCDDDDYSTVFYTNLGFSIIVYFLAYFSAPLVSDFFNKPILINIIRIYCLTFFVTAFSAVQFAKLTRDLEFKTQTYIEIPATIIAGGVGIFLAYKGFGVFSLVFTQIIGAFLSAIQVWFYSRWRPKFLFSMIKFKQHFNFGYKIAVSGVLDVLFRNSYVLVLGKFFSAAQVGFYTRAETMKQLPVNNISSTLNTVTFPLFAQIKNDDIRLKRVYKQLMEMVVYVIAPVLIFIAVLAEPVFRFLFTEKWLPAVPYFQILCFTGILSPIHSYNLNLLKVKGRSDLFLKLTFYEKIIIVLTLIIGFQFGIYGILLSQVAVSLLIFFINAYYTDKFISYSALDQLKTIFPIIFLATVCGAMVFLLDIYLESQIDIIRILSGGIFGAILYASGSWLLKMSSFNHFKSLIITYIKKRNHK